MTDEHPVTSDQGDLPPLPIIAGVAVSHEQVVAVLTAVHELFGAARVTPEFILCESGSDTSPCTVGAGLTEFLRGFEHADELVAGIRELHRAAAGR